MSARHKSSRDVQERWAAQVVQRIWRRHHEANMEKLVGATQHAAYKFRHQHHRQNGAASPPQQRRQQQGRGRSPPQGQQRTAAADKAAGDSRAALGSDPRRKRSKKERGASSPSRGPGTAGDVWGGRAAQSSRSPERRAVEVVPLTPGACSFRAPGSSFRQPAFTGTLRVPQSALKSPDGKARRAPNLSRQNSMAPL